MDIYKEILATLPNSFKLHGSMFTICKEQSCNTVIDTYLPDILNYEAVQRVKKSLHNIIIKDKIHTAMYIFTDKDFDKFQGLASEDTGIVQTDCDKISTTSMLSNLLYTSDSRFFAEDIPKLNGSKGNKYKQDEVYIVRLLHRVSINMEIILSEDIVIYMPARFVL